MDKSFNAKVMELIDSDFSKSVDLSTQDKQLIEDYAKAIQSYDGELPFPGFRNIILGEGVCGVLPGGHIDYLLNTDLLYTYIVQIRVYWHTPPFGTGSNVIVLEMRPQDKKVLGCSDTGAFPVTTFLREVVSERRKLPTE